MQTEQQQQEKEETRRGAIMRLTSLQKTLWTTSRVITNAAIHGSLTSTMQEDWRHAVDAFDHALLDVQPRAPLPLEEHPNGTR